MVMTSQDNAEMTCCFGMYWEPLKSRSAKLVSMQISAEQPLRASRSSLRASRPKPKKSQHQVGRKLLQQLEASEGPLAIQPEEVSQGHRTLEESRSMKKSANTSQSAFHLPLKIPHAESMQVVEVCLPLPTLQVEVVCHKLASELLLPICAVDLRSFK